jgi:CelD/BcsL family acetyltransferase involved in cellulose biosynthesis
LATALQLSRCSAGATTLRELVARLGSFESSGNFTIGAGIVLSVPMGQRPQLFRSRQATPAMTTQVLRIADLTATQEEAWESLAERAFEPSTNEPSFMIPAARHIGSYADMTLFVVERDGVWLASMPLLIMGRSSAWPHRFAASRTEPRVVAGGPPLLDRDCPQAAARALLLAIRQAARYKNWPGIVLFERMNEDGPATTVLRQTWSALHMPEHEVDRWDRAILRRIGPPESWTALLGTQHKRDLTRRWRRLSDVLGGEPTFTDRKDYPEAIEDFLRLEATGWKGRKGSALGSTNETADFFRDWGRRYASAGRLHVFSLAYAGKNLAMGCTMQLGDSLFIFKIAYDESYASYSLGQHLATMTAEHFGQYMDLAVLDAPGDPDERLFRMLFPEKRTLVNVLVAVGGPLDRWRFRLYTAYRYFFAGGSRFRRLYLRQRLARLRATKRKASGS